MIQNNKAHVIGTICSPFIYDHYVCGEEFYNVYISTLRTSGTADVLLVKVSAKIVDVKQDMTGHRIEITGSFRSYNAHDYDRNTLVLYIWADSFLETDSYDIDHIDMIGYLCRDPKYRRTPLGREVTDMIIAINRDHNSASDYLPVIAWGRNAFYASGLKIGDMIIASGRIQSREYTKIIDGASYERIAYEVSISRLEAVGDENADNGEIQEDAVLQ